MGSRRGFKKSRHARACLNAFMVLHVSKVGEVPWANTPSKNPTVLLLKPEEVFEVDEDIMQHPKLVDRVVHFLEQLRESVRVKSAVLQRET